MNIRYNFSAKARLDVFCSEDWLYPVMNNILFEDGKATATNGHIIIRTPVNEISNLEDKDIEKLNGHMIGAIMPCLPECEFEC